MANIYSPSSSVITQPGNLFVSADFFIASGTATLTRGGKGNWYWSVGASQTVYLTANLGLLLRNFNPATVNYGFNGTASAPLSIQSVTAYYLISGAAITSGSVGISYSAYPANNAATAPTVTDLLAPSAFSTAIQTNMYATTYTPSNTALLPPSNSAVTSDVAIVTPASAAIKFWGIEVALNYNI